MKDASTIQSEHAESMDRLAYALERGLKVFDGSEQAECVLLLNQQFFNETLCRNALCEHIEAMIRNAR